MKRAFTSSSRTHSDLYLHVSTPAPPPPATSQAYLLLLHGFLSSHADLLSLASSLQSLNLPLIIPDIPLHGRSRRVRPTSLPDAARTLAAALAETVHTSGHASVDLIVIGYSMGGRLAMQLATLSEQNNYGFRVIALVLISAALPPRTRQQVVERRQQGKRIAESLGHVVGTHAFQDWLEEWYSRPMWGELSNYPGYTPMIQRKLSLFDDARVEEWATAARVMADYEMPSAQTLAVPAIYVHGVLDEKYRRLADAVTQAFTQCSVIAVDAVAHNVVVEAEAQLAAFITTFASPVLKRHGHVLEIGRLLRMEYNLGLKREMTVGGKSLTSREGLLVVVESTEGVRGIGDICPLPGLHEEDIESCVNEIEVAEGRLIGVAFAQHSSSLEEFEEVLRPFSRVSRCGLAAAILHMLTRAWCMDLSAVLTTLVSNSSRFGLDDSAGLFGHLEQVEVNGVLPRLQKSEESSDFVRTGDPDFQNFSRVSHFRVLKLKVGMTQFPFQEGKDCGEAAYQAARQGQQVRLDANRAWSKTEFRSFRDGLAHCSTHIEFIEEPLRSVEELAEYIEEESRSRCSNHTHLALNVALDETLSESSHEVIQDLAIFPSVSALVIKPAVVGSIMQILSLCKVARQCSCKVVMSTIFESGVGIAWTALLASVLGANGTCHGLGTYSYLSRDVTEFSFQETCILGTSQRVSVRDCWQFLDRAAERVVKGSKS